MNKRFKLLCTIFLCSIAVAMSAYFSLNSLPSDWGAPIQSTEGNVKLYLDASECIRTNMGIDPDAWRSFSKIIVNGKTYSASKDEDGRLYIEAKESTDSIYNVILHIGKTSSFFSTNGLTDYKLPMSQFWKSTIDQLATFPMYASYNKENGNVLKFAEAFGVICIELKGKGEVINSVRVQTNDNKPISGQFSYKFGQGLVASKNKDVVVLNTTNHGDSVRLSEEPTRFYLAVNPGEYAQGLSVRVCDAYHRMMEFSIAPQTISPNEMITVNKEYAPDADLIYFEGYDNYVWGGDYIAGSTGVGFSPSATNPGIDGNLSLTGYEEALVSVNFGISGSAFTQSNTWSEVDALNLKTSHQMSDSYLTSRNIWDMKYMFRVQEYPGYIAIGAGNTYRGIYQTHHMLNTDELCTTKIAFDLAFAAGYNDEPEFDIINGGKVNKVLLDGVDITDKANKGYKSITSTVVIPKNLLTIATSGSNPKKWHHIELIVNYASSGTQLYLAGNTTSSGTHGIFLDNLEVRKVKPAPRGKIRLLYWNIQNGMWADQPYNYDNFVAWVKALDPDICVWCESCSNYKNNTTSSLPTEQRYLPNKGASTDTNEGWAELAARYGHQYSALGGHRDNFPQEITSKFPIKTIKRITSTDNSSKPIAHGAAIQQVDIDGRKINFITMHTWPQSYGYGVSSANQAASTAANEGDYYREYEMNYVLNNTYLNPEYSKHFDWFLVGDLNSRSRLDNWYYNYADNSTRLLCQDVILNKTDLVDVIAYQYPGDFCASTQGNSRIDYVYASPRIYKEISSATIIKDFWTTVVFTGISNFYWPSDHRPILVEIDLKNITDPTEYEEKEGLKINCNWIRSVRDEMNNMPVTDKGTYNHGFCVLNGVVYLAGRTGNSSTSNSYLDRYDANTGISLGRLELSKDVQCANYPCNDVIKDDAGHLLVTNYLVTVSSKPLRIYQIDPSTGNATLRAECTTSNGTSRLDHCLVKGDITSGNFTIWASISNSSKVLRWQSVNGEIKELAPITLSSLYPATANNMGISSRICLTEEGFVVNANKIIPTQYDLQGKLLNTFNLESKACPNLNSLQTNGFSTFNFGKARFAIYPATDYSHANGHTFYVSKMPAQKDKLNLEELEHLWTIPEGGLGAVNSTIFNAQTDYQLSAKADTMQVYLYVSGNGLARYDITGECNVSKIQSIKHHSSALQITNRQLSLAAPANVKIYGTDGKLVLIQDNTHSVSLLPLATGTYIVETIANGKKETTKIQIK